MSKCSKCNQRKPKRSCPVFETMICPICCSEHREKVTDCPEDCAYFVQSKEYSFIKELHEDEAKVNRLRRQMTGNEPEYLEFLSSLEEEIALQVIKDEYYEDQHILSAIENTVESLRPKNPLEIQLDEQEKEREIVLDRVGVMTEILKSFNKRFLNREDKPLSVHQVILCLENFTIVINEIKAESENPNAFLEHLKTKAAEIEEAEQKEEDLVLNPADSEVPIIGQNNQKIEKSEAAEKKSKIIIP